MLAEQDRRTFADAGILDPEDILIAAASFLRRYAVTTAAPNALSEVEADWLRQSGAEGVDTAIQAPTTNLATVAGEYAQMVATALSQQQVADYLQVSTARVRQHIDAHSLYAIEGPNGRVCPHFQFWQGATLPGLDAVIAAINSAAHPVVVQRFFLSVSLDLESDLVGGALSPRDWLLAGHGAEAVVTLAHEL